MKSERIYRPQRKDFEHAAFQLDVCKWYVAMMGCAPNTVVARNHNRPSKKSRTPRYLIFQTQFIPIFLQVLLLWGECMCVISTEQGICQLPERVDGSMLENRRQHKAGVLRKE